MSSSILRIRGLRKYFPVSKGFLTLPFRKKSEYVRAVDSIDLELGKGHALALVGESGCGKTTLGKLIMRLIDPTGGEAIFDEVEIFSLKSKELKALRKRIQMVFQDPYRSLNPRMRVNEAISHPLRIHTSLISKEIKKNVFGILDKVELNPPEFFWDKYPHQLSGGQRQRVALARCLVLRPELVVADEPTSALDASTNAHIINLMVKLKEEFDLTYLFITHDLATAKYICNDIAVMYLGKIVELGPLKSVYLNPRHPYTAALLSAIHVTNPDIRPHRMTLRGDIAQATDYPGGCRFHPRCPYVQRICTEKEPEMMKIGRLHYVACHRADEIAAELKEFVRRTKPS